MDTAPRQENSKLNFQKKNRPAVLVAGGAGFIGSFLCEALVAQEHNVICVDNLESGSKANIEKLSRLPSFTFWEEDINKPGFTLPPTIQLSHIFHLAGVEKHRSDAQASLSILLVNSYGTKNLLDLAVSKKSRFVLVSSTEVFHGAVTQTSLYKYFKGSQNITQTSFAEAKRFAESLTAEYLKKQDLNALVVRVKDPYGPRMDLGSGNPLASMLAQIMKKDKIEIQGDGLGTLNPTFVTDIVFGILKASIQGEKGGIYNLISQEKFTVRSSADILKKISGVDVEYKKTEETELPEPPLLLEKSEEALKWSPKVGFEEGLKQTIGYYKEQHQAGNLKKDLVKTEAPQLRITKIPKAGRGVYLKLLLVLVLVVAMWYLVLPVLLFGSQVYLGSRNLTTATEELKKTGLESSVNNSKNAASFYRKSQNSVDDLAWIYKLTGRTSGYEQTQSYLFSMESLAAAVLKTAKARVLINEAAKAEANKVGALESLKEAKETITQARSHIETAKLFNFDSEQVPFFLKQSVERSQYETVVIENSIAEVEKSITAVGF